jgi:hypothetical protein
MNRLRSILEDADPLRDEPRPGGRDRDRLRRAVAEAASGVAAPSSARPRVRAALLATVALMLFGMLAAGSWLWPQGATVQAAVRFEVRLAEEQPAAGLREARIQGTDRVIYLHEEVIVSNADIERSAVVPGSVPSRFNIGVRFNAAGAEKMRRATANHVGRPIALLIENEVVMAPVLRDPIVDSAVISGDYSQAEAERIVNGMSVR